MKKNIFFNEGQRPNNSLLLPLIVSKRSTMDEPLMSIQSLKNIEISQRYETKRFKPLVTLKS